VRRLVVTENITVDGVIDMSGGWFDPSAAEEDIAAANAEHMTKADALLVGRNTFEAFRDFWPQQTQDTTGVSDYLNSVSKYVVSGTLDEPGWENSSILRGDPVEEAQALKAAEGAEIVTTGSIRLVHALMAGGVVDEYRLFVYPVAVGSGARLFEGFGASLQLLESRPFASGALLVRYAAVAG
jgi:dihydrofolate reductase